MEPAGGVVTGIVFNGEGRLALDVPNTFESAQLARFSHKAGGLDTAFTALVLRSADRDLTGRFAAPASAEFAPNTLARDRRASWLKDSGLDVDARIVASLVNPADPFVFADVKTQDFGWLSVRFEPWDAEELTVARSIAGDWFETWLSLDRKSERDPQGNPASDVHRLIDVVNADIDADLGHHRGELMIGSIEPPRPDPIAFRVRLTFVPLEEGLAALPFELDGTAEVSAVRAGDGAPLSFLRDNFGKRYALVANERSVSSLIVLLDRPAKAGEPLTIEFDYVMRTLNFVSGREWYPGPPDAFRDRHTVRATIRGPAAQQVRAVGDFVSDTIQGDRRTTVWSMERPTKMFGFSFGSHFKEEKIALEGAPEVVAFGEATGVSWGKMLRNVAVDVAQAQKFYQGYFRRAPPAPLLRVTAITGDHGQAFEGFLHLGQWTFNAEHPGGSEVFRGHEVAHQYWGHIVGWKGYRDQWLSESFAEYSALMFVEAALPKDKYFDRILGDFAAAQLGSAKGGTEGYDPPFAVWKPELRADLGPIAAGYRAGTVRVPDGYRMQLYQKGPLVLHTIRTVLSSLSRQQDLFRIALADFIQAFDGKDPSTEDFIAFLEARTAFPWRPFFQAYVFGTEIPTFAWRWTVSGSPDDRALEITIEASHVPEGFVLPIPLALDFGRNKTAYTFVRMEGRRKEFKIPIPSVPQSVRLAPNNSVLARIETLK